MSNQIKKVSPTVTVGNTMKSLSTRYHNLLPKEAIQKLARKTELFFSKGANAKLFTKELMPITSNHIVTQAMSGLYPGEDYYLIPYGKEVNMIRRKEGYIKILRNELKRDNIEIVDIISGVILKKDKDLVSVNILTKEIKLKDDANLPSLDYAKDLKDIYVAFATIKLSNGLIYNEVLSGEVLEKRKEASQSKASAVSPWKKWTVEMANTKVTKSLIQRIIDIRYGYDFAELSEEEAEIKKDIIQNEDYVIEEVEVKEVKPKKYLDDRDDLTNAEIQQLMKEEV